MPISFDQKRLNDVRKLGTEKEANKKGGQLILPVSFDQKRSNDARKLGTEKEANKKEVRIIIPSRILAITSDVLDQSFWKLSCK